MFKDIWNWIFNKRARRFYCHRILRRFGILSYPDYIESITWLYLQAIEDRDFLDTMDRFIIIMQLDQEIEEN